MMVHYVQYEDLSLSPAHLAGLCELHDAIFVGRNAAEVLRELERKHKFLILLAEVDGSVAGFKIGFEERSDRFYSWLGGVHPAQRRHGIASASMERQHAWCREQGYRVVRTHTKNKWREMLILNLKHGLDVVGTYTDDKGEPKIILERIL